MKNCTLFNPIDLKTAKAFYSKTIIDMLFRNEIGGKIVLMLLLFFSLAYSGELLAQTTVT